MATKTKLETFEETFLNQKPALDASEYQKDEKLATRAKEIINEIMSKIDVLLEIRIKRQYN